MAEAAIVMFSLLLLMLGIVDFGRALYTYEFLTNVAGKAARWAIVRGSSCTLLDHCGVDGATDPNDGYITQWVGSQDVGIVDKSKIVITGNSGAGDAPGNVVVVSIKYPFSFLPFVSKVTVNFQVATSMRMVN